MNICVRDVEGKLFRSFKAEAVREGKKMSEAVNEALSLWIQKKHEKPKLNFRDYKPTSWGKGTEKASEQIDQILYGE